MKFFFVLFFILTFLNINASAYNDELSFYNDVIEELTKFPRHISEDQCLPGYVRDPKKLNSSLRSDLDLRAPLYFKNLHNTPTLIFFGSGKLLNETTIIASLMSHGISPTIVLVDLAYDDSADKIKENQENLHALQDFKIVIKNLSEKYKTTPNILVYTDFKFALSELLSKNEKISAFFMLDVYYPTTFGFSVFQNTYNEVLNELKDHYTLSYESYFFFLNKKEEGPILFPVPEKFIGPPTAGFDAAILNIMNVEFKNGFMGTVKTVYSHSIGRESE